MIGIFDSGYGGLTILGGIRNLLPQYDYLYLGDNARAPYGPRSFDIVYEFTLQAVNELFRRGCPLVILACNTASAKALRTIQQHDLPKMDDPAKRVLGVIRPTVESIGSITRNHHVGILGTAGTICSDSYPIEIAKLYPDIHVASRACPMWVPLVEYGESKSPGADYFVEKYIDEIFTDDPEIDTLILGCTHYPLLIDKIKQHIPSGVKIISQGSYVADSLKDYLHRHPEIDKRLTRGGRCHYLTTENASKFVENASMFLDDSTIEVETVVLG